MSRSYKKHPIFKDPPNRKTPHRYRAKTLASRKVRRTCVPSGKGGFRRIYDSWDICDYRFRVTEAEFRRKWERGEEWLHKRFKTYKQAFRYWRRYYRNK